MCRESPGIQRLKPTDSAFAWWLQPHLGMQGRLSAEYLQRLAPEMDRQRCLANRQTQAGLREHQSGGVELNLFVQEAVLDRRRDRGGLRRQAEAIELRVFDAKKVAVFLQAV